MSRDLSSPAEAAIAERRLKVLMEKYDISIAEINRSQRAEPAEPLHANRYRERVRKRRTRPNVKWKQPRPSRRLHRTFALVAVSGFAVVLTVWFSLPFFNQRSSPISTVLPEKSSSGDQQRVAAALDSRIDSASIIEGETVVLHIAGTGLSSVPDISSLWRDFNILATDERKIPETNGLYVRVMLQPRRAGTIMIPSFYANGARSEHIILDVLDRNL